MNTKIEFVVVESLPGDALEMIESTLRQFNVERNAAFWAAREVPANAPKPLNVVARDTSGQVIGGLMGETQFAWLRISMMSVAEAHRRRGVGKQLLAAAEKEAVQRGCRYAYVDTMDYQAPEFYARLGYDVVGRLENWDSHGHCKVFFVKRLQE